MKNNEVDDKKKANLVGTFITPISLLAAFLGFLYNLYPFYEFPEPVSNYFKDTFLGTVSNGTIDEIQIYIIFFVALHFIRIHFGVNFISYDQSFSKVLAEIDDEKRKSKALREIIIRIILFISIQIFNIIFWRSKYELVCGILIIQGVLIFAYNINYWNELFKRDDEFKANYFIIIGDIMFLFTGIFLSLESYFWFKKLVIFIIGGYTSIFIGECISQYLSSIKLLFADINLKFKELKESL